MNSIIFNTDSTITPVSLAKLLHETLDKIHASAYLAPFIEQLSRKLPVSLVEDAVRLEFPEHQNAFKTAHEILKEAKISLASSGKLEPSLSSKLTAALDACIAVLQSFIDAFGIADFFTAPKNLLEKDLKGQRVMLLLSLFSLVTGILVPVIGAAASAKIIGSILAAISALSLLFPWIQPPPSHLTLGTNWSKQIREGQLEIVNTRRDIVKEIAQALTSKQTKTHPLLLGKSGVGKTETAKAFAQAIEFGEYPELKGKQVFYFNMADLMNYQDILGSGDILLKINQELGRHRDRIILVLDEIHLACKADESLIGEQLKTLLDPGKDHLPYVIGITTEEEFSRDIYLNNTAFARRFKKIEIQSTSPQETAAILGKSFLKNAPNTLLANGMKTLQYLQQKVDAAYEGGAIEPASSLQILSTCIQKTQQHQKSDLEKRIESLRYAIEQKQLDHTLQRSSSQYLMDAPYENIAQALKILEEELHSLKLELKKEQQELAKLNLDRENFAQTKASLYATALKTNLCVQDQNRLLLQHYFLLPHLKKVILEQSEKLKVHATITEAMIDQTIAEAQANHIRAQQMAERGRKDLAARGSCMNH